MNAAPRISLMIAAMGVAQKYPVFPCNEVKQPRVAGGFKRASRNEGEEIKWWSHWPDALIGVPTGSPTRLVVIDCDTAKKPDAESSAWIERSRALLDGTCRHTTTSGGTHYLF